ncbi:MAG: monovalent cation/H(+) antiporter subunit G [Cryobacterium sp.]
MTILEIIGQVLIILGGIIFVTGALGIIRFPDAYTRASAVGTAGGLGVMFVVTGALLMQPTVTDTLKVVLIVVLQLATSAIGIIAVARSAYLVGVPLARRAFDDLGDHDAAAVTEQADRAADGPQTGSTR